MSTKHFAKRTDTKIRWALNRYLLWWNHRTSEPDCDPQIKATNLEFCDDLQGKKTAVCYTLQRFITEIKKQDGNDYPGQSLYELVIMLQFQLEKKKMYWKLFDDPEFVDLRHTVDYVMRQRSQRGLGKKEQSLPATITIQNRLWEAGFLGTDTPDKLRDTLQWLIGYHFALRGGSEHRVLRFPGSANPSQLQLITDADGDEALRYREDLVTKNDQGGLGKRPQKPKEVFAYGPENTDRNIVEIYKTYISKCPVNGRTDALFRQSVRANRLTDEVWYTKQPVGLNTLGVTVKNIMLKAGIPGKWTNHSLRSGCATTLHHANVEEQTIKNVTGHRSDAVRDYKRESLDTIKRAERALVGRSQPNPHKRSSSEPNYTRHKPIISWNHSRPTSRPLTPPKQLSTTTTPHSHGSATSSALPDQQTSPESMPPPRHVPHRRRTAPATMTRRNLHDSFECQPDEDTLDHTKHCHEKRRNCSENHDDDKCCNFLCGFTDFIHGAKVPPKKFKMSLTFQRAKKYAKQKSSSSDEQP
jgi:hypothetical protein